jgi:hypothetical protein
MPACYPPALTGQISRLQNLMGKIWNKGEGLLTRYKRLGQRRYLPEHQSALLQVPARESEHQKPRGENQNISTSREIMKLHADSKSECVIAVTRRAGDLPRDTLTGSNQMDTH